MTLYCQKLSAVISDVPVWCVGVDGHTEPCSWPTNLPSDGNLRVKLPPDYNFRVDPGTGAISLEQRRT